MWKEEVKFRKIITSHAVDTEQSCSQPSSLPICGRQIQQGIESWQGRAAMISKLVTLLCLSKYPVETCWDHRKQQNWYEVWTKDRKRKGNTNLGLSSEYYESEILWSVMCLSPLNRGFRNLTLVPSSWFLPNAFIPVLIGLMSFVFHTESAFCA